MANIRSLPEIFNRKVVVFDGAMGSLLHERGVQPSHPFEELNLSSPDVICQAHAEYIRAGAMVIETNTFAANKFKLSIHGLEERTYDINRFGAGLAKAVAGKNALVAGSIGPAGVRLAPLGTASAGDIKDAITDQANGLAEGGADIILLETQTDLNAVLPMLEAVFERCGLPVICQFALGPDLCTVSGDSLDDIVSELAKYPVSAIGVNCSIGPEQTIRAVQALREITDLPISAQPNSGFPTNVDGRTFFRAGAKYFAERGAEIVKAGASIIGGCCGTTPEHIQSLVQAVQPLRLPAPAKVREPLKRSSGDMPAQCERSPLLRKMNGNFITMEVTPPKDANAQALIEKLRPLVDAGISAIDVTDNPMARMHMSAIAFAHLLKEQLSVNTILHLTCRDLNILGMHSALLGASALGVDGILALTGDPATVGDYPGATSVFDVTSDGLAKIINSLNCGYDYTGKQIGKSTSFAIGGAFNPLADDMEKELQRMEKKRKAGVNFLMTQPIFDIESLDKAVEALPGDWKPPILVGILPLRSARHAEFLHNEIPGITIPEPILSAMKKADAETAKEEGIRIAAAIFKAAKEKYAGAYFIPPFENFEAVRQVISLG